MKDFILGHDILRIETTLFKIFVPLHALHTAQYGGGVPGKSYLINDNHGVGIFPSWWLKCQKGSASWIFWQNWLLTSVGGDVLFENHCHGWWKCLTITKTALKNSWTLGSYNNLPTDFSFQRQPSNYSLCTLISQLFIFLFLLLGLFKEIMNFNQQNKSWMILIQGLTKSFRTLKG